MEFKGTKGKWVLYSASSPSINECTKWSVYNGTKRIALCYNLFENDTSLNVSVEEGKANALLISKAPEMLEMLQWLNRKGGLGLDVHEQIEQLIKQATEL